MSNRVGWDKTNYRAELWARQLPVGLADVFWTGRARAQDNEPRDSCPYGAGPERDAWLDGWDHGGPAT